MPTTNMQLAYANTVEALIVGADRLDATIAGLGRGAGNCALELLLAFLKNPKFHLRPVIECIEKHFVRWPKTWTGATASRTSSPACSMNTRARHCSAGGRAQR